MSKRQFLCLLGIWIMVFTFLGFPIFLKQVIAVASGLLVVIVAYNLESPFKNEKDSSESSGRNSFVENDKADLVS